MKILIDPMLAVLAQDLSTEDKAELLMCILEYPKRDCALGLWKYMKQQIDIDAKKYLEKCERAAAGRQKKSELKSSLISEMKSEPKSELNSAVKKEVVVSKNNIIKDNCNVRVSSNAKSSVDKSVDDFLITGNFSFEAINEKIPKFDDYLKTFHLAVVERAEKTLIKKRANQWLSLAEILDWIQQESVFYKQNHGSAR